MLIFLTRRLIIDYQRAIDARTVGDRAITDVGLAVGAWQGYDIAHCEQLITDPYEEEEEDDGTPPVSPIKKVTEEGKTYHLESDVDLSLDKGSPVNEKGNSFFDFDCSNLPKFFFLTRRA